MKIGFIGLGNVGGKLASSLLRNKFDLTVRDLDKKLTNHFKNKGSKIANSAKELAEKTDLIITCLPSPEICAEVMESKDGVINGLSKNKIWFYIILGCLPNDIDRTRSNFRVFPAGAKARCKTSV